MRVLEYADGAISQNMLLFIIWLFMAQVVSFVHERLFDAIVFGALEKKVTPLGHALRRLGGGALGA